MAYWGKTLRYTNKAEEIVRLGGGVNTELTPFEIKGNEAVDSSNTGSDNFPALSTRKGNTLQFGTDTNPLQVFKGAGVRNNEHLYIVDDTTLKRWNGSHFQVVITALSGDTVDIAELSTQARQYTVFVTGLDRYAYDGVDVIDLTDAPIGKLIAVDDTRLFILNGKTLSFCASGDPTDWTTVGDAGEEILVGMEGDGTALFAYNDIVIAWSEATMHLVYGRTTENYQTSNPIRAGCISNNSVVEHGGSLYFMDYNKFKVFTGGMPYDISDKIKGYLTNINYNLRSLICAGAKDDYIYLSIPYGQSATTNNMVIRYDVGKKTWYPSHDKGYLQFVNIGNNIYGFTKDGKIEKLEDGTVNNTAPISWYHITGIRNPIPIKARKTIKEYWLSVDLPANSTLKVEYSVTSYGNDFANLYDLTASADTQHDVVMIPTDILQEVDGHRLKFSGVGPCTIHYLEPHVRVKSR
jgi:hypothetical protein